LAYKLREEWYKEELLKSPIKPIGVDKDTDSSIWGNDYKFYVPLKAQFKTCPMLPDCEELKDDRHPANWSATDTPSLVFDDDQVYDSYKFSHKGIISLIKRSKLFKIRWNNNIPTCTGGDDAPMLDINNQHLYEELVLYKKRSNRIGLILDNSEDKKYPIPVDNYGIVRLDFLLN